MAKSLNGDNQNRKQKMTAKLFSLSHKISEAEFKAAIADEQISTMVSRAVSRICKLTPRDISKVPIMHAQQEILEGTVHKFKRAPRDIAIGTSVGFPRFLAEKGLLRSTALDLAAVYVIGFAMFEHRREHSYANHRFYSASFDRQQWTAEYQGYGAERAALPYRAAATIALEAFSAEPSEMGLPDHTAHAAHIAGLANPLCVEDFRELHSVLK
jgi:hypothetical protein